MLKNEKKCMNESSPYINQQRRDYGLYVIRLRALPHAADGLKSSGRRILWVARDGHKYKSATLAANTMPIHPHQSPESVVDTLAAPFGNNITLLEGDGAFGTLLEPTASAASRYTQVKITNFTKDVMFADIDIIPMIENYDGNEMEPKHFLPLVPMPLVNPSSGTAIGFASEILARPLKDIINLQIDHLEGKKISKAPAPYFLPIDSKCYKQEKQEKGGIAYYFRGYFETIDKSTIRVTKLPYGLVHSKFVEELDFLINDPKKKEETVIDYEDSSRDTINILVKFKRGYLATIDEDDLMKKLGLIARTIENFNVIDFSGNRVWNTDPIELIKEFTDWRLGWYKTRYERLQSLLKEEIQRYEDILVAIKHWEKRTPKDKKSRETLKDFIKKIGVVNVDYIADLPVYRFTVEEEEKVEEKLAAAKKQLQEYKDLLTNEGKRRKVYVNELNAVLKKYA